MKLKQMGFLKGWLKIIIIILLLVVFAVGIYAFFTYQNAKKTVNEEIHHPIQTIDTHLTKEKVKETRHLNILLLGIDAYENESGRSDALMVMRLHPEQDAMTIVSIPRDTRTKIIGKETMDKINHAYAFGGADMSVATVEDFLDIEIDYYVSINMDGLIELVDALGTITVQNNIAWSNGVEEFPVGLMEMDGDKTMSYVRMRKQDPTGDFGRTARHRKVIEGIIREGITIGSVPKLNSIVQVLGNNMATNMDFTDMRELLSGYKDTRKNISEYMLDGTEQRLDNIYYFIPSEESIKKAHTLLAADKK